MKANPVDKETLDYEIISFIEEGISYSNEEKFNELSIKEFIYQYFESDYYRNLCLSQGLSLRM